MSSLDKIMDKSPPSPAIAASQDSDIVMKDAPVNSVNPSQILPVDPNAPPTSTISMSSILHNDDSKPDLKRKRSPENSANLTASDVPSLDSPAVKSEDTNSDALPDSSTSSSSSSVQPVIANGKIVETTKPQLIYTPLKTGYCYDVRMRYHAKIVTSNFDYVDPHPEDPRRIYRVYKALAESGIIIDPKLEGLDEVGSLMQKITIRFASDEELLLVHTQEHLSFIKSTTTMTRDQLIEETEKGDSVYFNNDSYTSALLSCGGAIEVCKAVVERKVKNAIAIVRPPGHHAEPGNAAGFCLFSNVAVAAKTILRDYPESVRKILVLDWDVHHGNGTQRAFYNDPRVLYMSLHRYEGGKFYPGTDYGSHTKTGEGKGEGYNVNIPWSAAGMGDADYIYAMNRVILPIAIEFDPDLVIISSGFDAAEGDPIGGYHLTPNAYGYLTHMMKVLANGNLVVVMEGGYNLDSIAKSALAVTKVLVGEIPGRPLTKTPQHTSVQDISDVIREQSKYWECMRHGYHAVDFKQTEESVFIPEVIRTYQARELFEKYGMTSLPVLKDKIQDTIDAQILATPNIHKENTIIVIVHDTPEIWAERRPLLGTIDPSQSLLIDAARQVTDWARGKDYGVVDMMVPGIAGINHSSSYSIGSGSQDLCIYLWDDYMEYFTAQNIVFVGIGEAYAGIVYLAGHRDLRVRVKALIAFVDDMPLRPITPVIDEYISEWFFQNSLFFTSHEHSVWDTSVNPKKPRRKFGRVIRSNSIGAARVARERFEEASEYLEDVLEDPDEEESSAAS